jgi:glutaredoxin-related protein
MSVARAVLAESRLHPAIRERVAKHHHDVIAQAQAAIDRHPVVVLGMRQNPLVKRARRALDSAGVAHEYIEHGSYFSEWRRRNALKMWAGWPTFPMVFVKGSLVGGADDLQRLIVNGELGTLLA